MQHLIHHQVDPSTQKPYKYQDPEHHIIVQKAIFGRRANKVPIDDPDLIQELLEHACPDDGFVHVLPLDTSFPSKSFGDGYYPVSRQHEWATMDMHAVADSEIALKHPLNLREFYRTYSPHVDIRFVALSNPFVEAVTRHMGNDGGPEEHMAVLSGYLLLIRTFLDWMDTKVSHVSEGGARLWTLVCTEQLTASFYDGNVSQVMSARNDVVYRLSEFLGWPQNRCTDCFDHWRESSNVKGANAERKLLARGRGEGKPHIMELLEMKM